VRGGREQSKRKGGACSIKIATLADDQKTRGRRGGGEMADASLVHKIVVYVTVSMDVRAEREKIVH
jgi:hypothetical protein